MGQFRELHGNELKLILDKGAQINIMIQKHERILSSGRSKQAEDQARARKKHARAR